jgi:hypothetical protein
MKYAQILCNKVHWIFEADAAPEFSPDIVLVDITSLAPQPQEGWLYDDVNDLFTEPEPGPLPSVDTKPLLVITEIASSDTENTAIDLAVGEVTCAVGTILTATVEFQAPTGEVIPLTASFRMPVQSRDGREMVALAKFINGIAEITIPFTQSGVWQVREETINSTLPPDSQMLFAGLTIYVVL